MPKQTYIAPENVSYSAFVEISMRHLATLLWYLKLQTYYAIKYITRIKFILIAYKVFLICTSVSATLVFIYFFLYNVKEWKF